MTSSFLITHCKTLNQYKEHHTFQKLIIMDEQFIRIQDGHITAIGAMDKLPSAEHDEMVLDGKNKLAMPGLINAHNHCAMTLFRGMADDLELHDWLQNHIFPAEARYVTDEMVYWCSKLAAAEMLLSGTTCVADGYFCCDQTAQAFEEAGIRAIVAHGILDFPTPGVADPTKNLATVAAFLQRWQGKSDRVSPAVFAHSPYTCSPTTLMQAKKLADSQGVRFFIHLGETEQEAQMIMDPQGKTPVQHLANLGILDSNCICIHAVWLNEQDIEIIQKTGTHVVFCPQSNYKLASGISPAKAMQEKGIRFGLGTDGCASNNSLDMFREMRMFAQSHKVFQLSPTLFPAHEVLAMACENNHTILGFAGTPDLAPGNRADLLLLDLRQPHLTPLYNPDLLVYGAQGSDVDTVFVAGRLVVKERKILTFDLQETMEKVRTLARPLHSGREQ